MSSTIGRDRLKWKDSKLWFGDQMLYEIVPDSEYEGMFRIREMIGGVGYDTDMVNLTRAKDGAISLALKKLNNNSNDAI